MADDEIKSMLKALLEGQESLHARMTAMEERMDRLEGRMAGIEGQMTKLENSLRFIAGDVYLLKKPLKIDRTKRRRPQLRRSVFGSRPPLPGKKNVRV